MISIETILHACDHTLLTQTATWEEIRQICDDAIRFGCASVCIPPSYVRRAAEYCGEKMTVCTVIGFPNGYSTTAAKCYETEDAVKNGAGEIDMVVNLGWVKDREYEAILSEIRSVKQAAAGKTVKVIIETCLLTEAEKIALCDIVNRSGADFIKTSTGFSTGGATGEDVALLRAHSDAHVKVKASGGIATLDDARRYLSLGAERLGTSRIVKAVKAVRGECSKKD